MRDKIEAEESCGQREVFGWNSGFLFVSLMEDIWPCIIAGKIRLGESKNRERRT